MYEGLDFLIWVEIIILWKKPVHIESIFAFQSVLMPLSSCFCTLMQSSSWLLEHLFFLMYKVRHKHVFQQSSRSPNEDILNIGALYTFFLKDISCKTFSLLYLRPNILFSRAALYKTRKSAFSKEFEVKKSKKKKQKKEKETDSWKPEWRVHFLIRRGEVSFE